jgi:hypothetical protein
VRKLISEILQFFRGMYQANVENSVSALQLEYNELNYTFLVVLMGSFVGIKTVPPLLSLELLEAVKDELKYMASRAAREKDVFADFMASLGGEW